MEKVDKSRGIYIYLNGIKPIEDIPLRDDVTLLPCSCNPTPDMIINKCSSEIDIGVACIFLRSVSASLFITGKTPKELAISAWNSQWDAMLLAALYDREIGFNFQSDVAPENFHKANVFHITNYKFKGLNSGELKIISCEEKKWLQKHYKSAWELLDIERFHNAIHCLASYRWHTLPRAQMALIWSGIEGLFQIDYELSFRLSLYIAKYLAPGNIIEQKMIFDEVKKLYGTRSKAVHGGAIESLDDSVKLSACILRRIVMKAAEEGFLPGNDQLIFQI